MDLILIRLAIMFCGLMTILHISEADMMRKSIVFDIKTPKVFFCPQYKPKNMEKLIVRAVSLSKLCEFEGGELPKNYESDCYNDIDETDYACAEKQRIMLRINPPENSDATTIIPSPDAPEYIINNKKEIIEKKNKMKKNKKY